MAQCHTPRVNNRWAAAAACVCLAWGLASCGRVGFVAGGGDTSGWGWDVAIDDSLPVDPFLDDQGQPTVEAIVAESEPLDHFSSVSAEDVVGESVGIGKVGGWEVGVWAQQPQGEPVWQCMGVNDPNGGGDTSCGQGKPSEITSGLMVRTFCESGKPPQWAVLTVQPGVVGLSLTTADGEQFVGTDPLSLGLVGASGEGELESGAVQLASGSAYAVDVAGSCATGPA